ncbi:hypothetical protein PI23P_11087 [Polaribacter irgensii 23-P]|uniref:Uncharacterized protein n=1 Tax=Polaribacter irgensii 23-P TaxID=313594 RepID=A4C170_9FLAO|nr:hypothetical protein PI23P_11087 [Polaribacter irgensii 23-P]
MLKQFPALLQCAQIFLDELVITNDVFNLYFDFA